MRSVAIRLHAQLAAFAFIFSLSPLYRINARNNYGHYHGLCRDKFTKTPRWGRVETAERLLLEFLRYINAFACQELCFSPSLSFSLPFSMCVFYRRSYTGPGLNSTSLVLARWLRNFWHACIYQPHGPGGW